MSKEWFEAVVTNWFEAVEAQLGLPVEQIEEARRYIDAEYGDKETPFEYPGQYLALRAFFMTCMDMRDKASDDELWASPLWMALAATEKGYRMGYAHGLTAAQEQGKEKPNEDTTEA